jgi:hypothetical protein
MSVRANSVSHTKTNEANGRGLQEKAQRSIARNEVGTKRNSPEENSTSNTAVC